MRRIALALTVAVAVGLPAGCGGDDDDHEYEEARSFFGWVLGQPTPTAVAFDFDPEDKGSARKVRVYVCDGLGPPRGKAVWFAGPARSGTLTSANGEGTLTLNKMGERYVMGSFRGADGKSGQFVALPAVGGGGIYEVSVDQRLHVTGTSTEGHKLDAQASRDGRTRATITTADDEKLSFTVHNLSLATPARLRTYGLTNAYRPFRGSNQVPGEYVAVIAPYGSHWLGRSGAVRRGSPGANIIGLDKKE